MGYLKSEPRHFEPMLSLLYHTASKCVCQVPSVVSDSVTPQTVAHQALLSMGFFRQEYWSWLAFPPPGDLPNPGIKPLSLMSPALAGGFFTTSATSRDSHYWFPELH